MRLLSATVRNYRLHRDLRVDFDASRTVLGGPNESGKSTLIEAVHRALFLKARTGGELQKSMVSDLHHGHPEVEVAFEANGRSFRVAKQFGGAKGSATLIVAGSEALHGDEAEAALAKLLRVDSLAGGRGAAHQLAEQWAHLWVWQGKAGNNPDAHATNQKEALVARLRRKGGAAVMQSELDQQTAGHFAERAAETFTKAGNAKAGSPLSQASAALEQAEADHERARAAAAELREAVDKLHTAAATVARSEESLRTLHEDHEKTETALESVADLEARAVREEHALQSAGRDHHNLVQADEEIRKLRRQIAAREKDLEPGTKTEAQLDAHDAHCRARLQQAEEAVRHSEAAVRETRKRLDLARACLALITQTAGNNELARQAETVARRRRTLAKHQRELARIPPVDQKKLATLRRLAAEGAEAETALRAMAAGIEVLEANEPIHAGGTPLNAGELHVIDEDTEVTVGSAGRLRIRPGGGTSLAEARQRARRAHQTLAEALDSLGVSSLEEAAGHHEQRRQLDGRLREIQAELTGLGADEIDRKQQAAAAELERARADIERHHHAAPGFEIPASLPAAREFLSSAQTSLDSASEQNTTACAARDAASRAAVKSAKELDTHRHSLDATKTELTALKARLGVHLDHHGHDPDREEALARLAAARQTAARRLDSTREAIAKLNPTQLEADHARLKRAIDQTRTARNEAGKEAAVARHTLERDGATDPEGELELAAARLELARDRHAALDRRARAVKLLADLFNEEQRALADRFTRPLAGKVSGYLRTLFGPDAEARISLGDEGFQGLQLTRNKRTFRFESLSGGTREQLAAAVRLAMAEILAEDHGGCLPVVFDDAFANTDPERIQILQRMLDLAAARGLQVIILTCNPADYAGLGAPTVRLDPPSHEREISLSLPPISGDNPPATGS